MVRAECDQIVSTSASRNASRIIISIRVGLRTSRLENPRVCCGFTSLRTSKAPSTTIPRRVKRKASTFTSHNSSIIMGPNLKPNWAHHVEVANTASVAAFARSFDGCDRNGQVVTINKAYIIEVFLVSKSYFC